MGILAVNYNGKDDTRNVGQSQVKTFRFWKDSVELAGPSH
jgi:hypothetical protein